MLVEEMITPTRVHHYSDAGMMIRQIETDILYEDAVDNAPCKYTYEETDTPIPEVEREVEQEQDIIMENKLKRGFNMSNELIKEIIKSHVYGMSVVEMAQAYGLTEEEISSVLSENADEIAEERKYRAMLEGGC